MHACRALADAFKHKWCGLQGQGRAKQLPSGGRERAGHLASLGEGVAAWVEGKVYCGDSWARATSVCMIFKNPSQIAHNRTSTLFALFWVLCEPVCICCAAHRLTGVLAGCISILIFIIVAPIALNKRITS